MSENIASRTWAPFLLGALSSAAHKDTLLDVRSVLMTPDGPVIHAVDGDGDNLLITVDVKIVSEDEVPKIHDPNAKT